MKYNKSLAKVIGKELDQHLPPWKGSLNCHTGQEVERYQLKRAPAESKPQLFREHETAQEDRSH